MSQIDEIRDRLDIVQVISEYLQLQKTGANYRAICPFHSEKKPSFFVSPSKQIFKCFGCGVAGDVFKFIMQIEGIDFKEALQVLARKAGVELKREPIKERTKKQKLYDICELATKFFEKQLKETKKGKEAKEYLKERGIGEDLIKEWRIGYAPNTWRGLSNFLVAKGFKREDVVEAGLALRKEEKKEGLPYDRFRGRIIFPIFNLQDFVVGFGGRIFEKEKEEKETAKYINTPNTLIYDKSKILYGLNKAKVDIRKEDSVVLVEGYTDVILSHKAGVKNIVSSSGTSLTPYQLKILSRYTKNLVLGFDMDIAGESATKRGIDLAQFFGFDIRIISVSEEGKDPADIASKNPQEWQDAVENTKSIIDYYFEKAFSKYDKNTLEGKKQISKLLLPFISRIQNEIEKAESISRLAKELNVKEEALWSEIQKIKKENIDISQQYNLDEVLGEPFLKEDIKTRERRIEERLLMMLLKEKKYLSEIDKSFKFSFKEGQELFDSLRRGKKISKELDEFLKELELQFEIEREEKGEIDLEKEIHFCINSLKTIMKEKKIKEIIEKIREAEARGEVEKVKKLLEKIRKIQSTE